MPPDQKPAGQNIQWIPGYWSWDVSRGDYLWVSGIWREPPPNNQWVPGYWHQVQDGFQWVPGTWIPVSTGQGSSQPSYLPQPPQSLEAGPNTPHPSANVSWTPGYWSWQGANYAWRPGFWAAVQPNWIWIPAHYVWTPSGHLFVPGYWDLPVANRGLMFAPVYYPAPVYAQPSFVFTPSISIVGSAVTANLFVQPATNQYLFGDFYAQNFVSVGITPWFSFTFATGRPAYYDPLFSYYAVINVQQNPRWVTQIRETYVLRRDNVAMRPPHTFVEQTRLIERNVNITRNVTVVDHRTMAMPLSKLAADPVAGKGLRMVRVNEAERQQLHQQVAQLHQFREQRLQQEREGARARAAGGAAAARPRPMNLPHSPIASRPAPHPAGSHADVAQRSENERQASRDSSQGREAHPAADAAEATPGRVGTSRIGSGERVPSFRPECRRVPAPIATRDIPPRQSGTGAIDIVQSHAQPFDRGRGAAATEPLIRDRPAWLEEGAGQDAPAAVSCVSLARDQANGLNSTPLGCMDRPGSTVESNQALELLSGAVRAWFEATFPQGPTPAQEQAWPAIAAGEHVLLVSPTGTGKTLAAFLAILDRLFRALEAGSTRTGLAVRLRFAPAQPELRHRTQPERAAGRDPAATRCVTTARSRSACGPATPRLISVASCGIIRRTC